MTGNRLKIDLSAVDILGHLILWLIVSILTVGIGLFFLPYSFAAFIVNRVTVVDANGNAHGRLKCELELSSQIGHIVLWMIISILTLGVGYFFYLYKTWGLVISKTRIYEP